jgi:hypothetical protein
MGGKPTLTLTARMTCDLLILKEDGNTLTAGLDLHLRLNQVMRNGVIVLVELDVVINIHPRQLELKVFIARRWQWFKRRFVQHLKLA